MKSPPANVSNKAYEQHQPQLFPGEYRKKAWDLLLSLEGLERRSKRSID